MTASWKFVERPAHRLRHRFAERPAASSRTRRRVGVIGALAIGVSVVALGMGVAAALPSTSDETIINASPTPLSRMNPQFSALVGRAPGDVAAGTPLRVALLENGADYGNVDLSAKVIPATLLRGGLFGKAPAVIAISLNGRITAVVTTTPTIFGTPAFRVVLPRAQLRSGANDLRLFEVRGTPDAPQLAPVPWSVFKPAGR